jgi:hypothetical protein
VIGQPFAGRKYPITILIQETSRTNLKSHNGLDPAPAPPKMRYIFEPDCFLIIICSAGCLSICNI